MATMTANATASLSANGTSTATGSITWTAPSLPAEAVVSSVRISGTWTWNGKGRISRVTINGTNTSADTPFDVSLSNSVQPPITVTCVGGNKNATGSNFGWTSLIVTYTYSVPGTDQAYIKVNGVWQTGKLYEKKNGIWTEITDLASISTVGKTFVSGN